MIRRAVHLGRADACIDEQRQMIAAQEARIVELEERLLAATEQARVADGILRKLRAVAP